MSDVKREFGVVGLGRMGGGLSLQARDKGIRIVGFDPAGLRPELEGGHVLERPHELHHGRPRAAQDHDVSSHRT
jgi:6-phosphogluconate dehydrogenase